MILKGLQKTTLLDFPGRVACTVFTGGCNFRCPFCHNASLVVSADSVPSLSEDEFFAFLKKRKGILDGVCITGGEPMLQNDIIPFMDKIHTLGLAVKLDTNGWFTDKLKQAVSMGVVDLIAMDIKNSRDKYAQTVGLDRISENVFESIDFIMSSGVPYEFRTTVVKELHDVDDIISIGRMIEGAEQYYLQCFKDSGEILAEGYTAHDKDTMEQMLDAVRPYVKKCELRGI